MGNFSRREEFSGSYYGCLLKLDVKESVSIDEK